jgi:hypothetical protein
MEDVSDILAWFTVYFPEHPESDNIKRNILLAYRRGMEVQRESTLEVR